MLTFPPPPQGYNDEEWAPDSYAGNLASGVRHGSSKYTWSDNTAFRGSYEQGAKHGHGTLTFADGSKYEGGLHRCWHTQFASQVANFSRCASVRNTTRMVRTGSSYAHRRAGTFERGVVCGEGTWTYSNGDLYQGTFADGKKHGEGCYHFAKAQCQFVGTFSKGAFVSGRWVLRDGSSVAADTFVPGEPAGVYMPSGAATCKFGRPGLQRAGEFKSGMQWMGEQVSAV